MLSVVLAKRSRSELETVEGFLLCGGPVENYRSPIRQVNGLFHGDLKTPSRPLKHSEIGHEQEIFDEVVRINVGTWGLAYGIGMS